MCYDAFRDIYNTGIHICYNSLQYSIGYDGSYCKEAVGYPLLILLFIVPSWEYIILL